MRHLVGFFGQMVDAVIYGDADKITKAFFRTLITPPTWGSKLALPCRGDEREPKSSNFPYPLLH